MPKLSERLDGVTLGATSEGEYEVISVPATLVTGVLTPPQITDAQEGEFLQVSGGLIVGAVGVGAGDHAPSHEQGGGDELSLDASQIATGVLDPARVSTAAEGEYVRMVGGVLVGDSPAGPGAGDIESVTAGDGLDGGGTSGAVTLSVEWGTGNLQVRHGDDAAYTDARTPVSHTHVFADLTGVAPSSHSHNASAITAGVLDPARISTAAEGEYVRLVGGVLVGATPSGGGSGDITDVVAGSGLTGGATSGSATLAVDFGTGANQVRHGNDAAYTDARTPTAHTHPISTDVSGLGTGVAAFLETPSSANLATAVTDETGSGSLVFATSPTLVTPVLGTPTSGDLSNCTALNATQLTSGTVPLARVTAGTPAGLQQLRVNADATALEYFTAPVGAVLGTTLLTLTTADQTALSWAVTETGTYQLDFVVVIKTTAITNQTVSFTVAFNGAGAFAAGIVDVVVPSSGSGIAAASYGAATLSAGAWTHVIAGLFGISYRANVRWTVTSPGTFTLSSKSSVTSIAAVISGVGTARKVA